MSYLRDYIDGDYEVTQYSSGGSVRGRLSGEIVASYTVYWTADKSIHPTTQKQIGHIREKLGIEINV